MTVGLSTTAIFSWLFFSVTLEMRPALLYSVVGFTVIPKYMTLNDLELLFRVKLCFRAGLVGSDRATFEK